MSVSTIFVDYQPFFGRVEEQVQFRAALEDVLHASGEEKLPYLFWLSGDAGIGKSALAGRFCDITAREEPFRGQFELLWVDCLQEDWQANLSLAGEQIGAPRLFELLYRVAQEHQWDEYFERYQTILHRCQLAEREAAAALTTVDEQGLWVPLSGIIAADFAKVVRGQGRYDMSPSKTFDLHALIERRLRTKMLPQQFNLFIHREEALALAIAEGLKRLATKQPLVVVLDSYEVVAEADCWLQRVVEGAGSQVVWLIAGREQPLQQSNEAPGSTFITPSYLPYRLIPFHMQPLSNDEIRAYFSANHIERPLDEDALNTISRATRGIPLAVRQAADIWATGKPISAIIGDTTEATPSADIVQKMTERYLIHCINHDAERILPKILRWLPEKSVAWYSLGANLNRAHQYDEAITAFEKAIELEPTYVSAYHGLGNIYDRLGQYDKAQAAYQQAIELSPNNAFSHYGLGNVYRMLRQYDDAIACYERANHLEPSLGYPYHGLGQVYREQGRYDEAILAFEKAIDINPTDVYPHNSLAHVYRALERYDEAIGVYEQATQISPSDPYPHHGLGQIYRHLGQYEKAITAFEQAIELDPLDTYPYNGLGHLYRALGHHEKAIAVFQQAIELDPLDGYAYKGLAEAYDELGDYQEALSAWEKASQLEPSDPAPYHELALLYRTLGRFDKAINAYQQVIELDPLDASPHHGLGNIYLTLGRYHEAEACYKRAIALDPQNAFAHQNLATIYLHQRKLKQAEQQLHQRIRLLPDNTFTPLVTLGVISIHQNIAGSQKLFQQALANWDIAWQQQLQPPAELLEDKAITLFCIGEAATAQETLAVAIKKTLPRHPTSLDRYKLLQSAPLPPRGIEKMIQML